MYDLGTILIIVGIIFAVLDFFVPYDRHRRFEGGLLTIGVILIGVGVLVTGTRFGNST